MNRAVGISTKSKPRSTFRESVQIPTLHHPTRTPHHVPLFSIQPRCPPGLTQRWQRLQLTLWQVASCAPDFWDSDIAHEHAAVPVGPCRISGQRDAFGLEDLDVVDVEVGLGLERLFRRWVRDVERAAVRGWLCDMAWDAIVRHIAGSFAGLTGKP